VTILLSLSSIASQGWIPPVICVVYSTLVYLILRPQIKEITRLTFQQNKYEGNFRFAHTRVRTFCESIAFYGGEPKENASAETEFSTAYTNFRQLTNRNTVVQFMGALTGGYMNVNGTSWTVALGFLAVYFIAISGQYEFKGVEDITTVSLQTQSAISALLSLPILLARFAPAIGECHRYVMLTIIICYSSANWSFALLLCDVVLGAIVLVKCWK
jgi:ABC-type uncharacterized transport system fused permease/ATPase subunit